MSNEKKIKITPKRRELLQAIDDGAVEQRYPLGLARAYTLLDKGPGAERRMMTVTASVRKLADAGLVVLAPSEPDAPYKAPRLWNLTDAGMAALAASPLSEEKGR